ncbi:hypothetical protein UFOVP223_98 [uncultured Caudovirales phage]|uniref:Uncharacterized protein n=1 Tax=uncultured Caudovirales phage TaxID=2100421 RepID=A0A6J5L4I3_9CAUD|nr:hypothetical protein UFOVP110_66 [uncultured Caudovirales phage]CAB5219589.1 hypothetical protein UFOVP223_98 [uncultured Caudovirales phage]
MTDQVQQRALSEGWDPEVASSLSVRYQHKKFIMSVADEHKNRAFDFEFGTQNSAPKGTLRRFGNENHAAGVDLAKMFNDWVDRIK